MTRAAHILDAVLAVLAQQGVSALSVRSVAAAAEISPSQVQYYYRTKNELIRAGFDHVSDLFLAELEAARPRTLLELAHAWLPLDERREHRARVWLAYAATAITDPALREQSATIDRQMRQWFIRVGLGEEVASQLFALIDGVTMHCLVLPIADRQDLAEQTITPFLAARGLLEHDVLAWTSE